MKHRNTDQKTTENWDSNKKNEKYEPISKIIKQMT